MNIPITITPERRKEILSKFLSAPVYVVGDLMWDEYIRGDTARISPEAPVPVVLVQNDERRPGGATNVLKNLRELGVPAGVLSVVGDDENGRSMKQTLDSWNLTNNDLIAMPGRPTSIKTRIIARNQQLLRIDRENAAAISENLETAVIETARKKVPLYKGIILSDYDKGLLTPRVIKALIEIATTHGIPVAVDPQVRHFAEYRGATVMTPNEKEASEGVKMPFPKTDTDSQAIGEKIMNDLQLDHLLLTRSQKGIALFEKSAAPYLVPALAREVYDVTGAGDTVIAVYTAAIASGTSRREAAEIANIAGGIVVGKFGTATVTADEIIHYPNY